jgi:hypothetical protein
MNKLTKAVLSSALLITAAAQQAGASVETPVSVDGPSSLSLLAIGLTGAVLLARYFKR